MQIRFELLYAMTLIALLEIIALWRGIDGIGLSVAIAAICLLAPSPIQVFEIMRILRVIRHGLKKRGEEKSGVNDDGSSENLC